MVKVTQAVSKYYDENNKFPSIVGLDKPFYARQHLSWRVWILPQLGKQELFNQFKTDEAWNSEHNIKLIEKMPEIYLTDRAAKFENHKPGTTTIQALSGDGGILDSERPGIPPSREAIVDGMSETALLAECHPSRATPWTKPDDFPFDPTTNDADVSRFGNDGEDFFVIVTVSGDAHRIRKDADVKHIDRMFQRDDKRETPWAQLKYPQKAGTTSK
ncbi:MAG: DUF1559 domain-containing protein [Pirellulales bacterium]|nr:DUF1559 domain-containing protein [Pirellulales bacterium]